MSALRTSLTSAYNGFLTALTFLTLIPLPKKLSADKPDFSHALPWFPIIGLLIGSITAFFSVTASLYFSQGIVSVLVIILLSGMSGFLHLDGAADMADGFFSSRPKERILEIMKDSRVGPMGGIVLILLLLMKYAAYSTTGLPIITACLLVPFSGRVAIILQMGLLPYARKSGTGIGDLFEMKAVKKTALFYIAILAVFSFLFTQTGMTVVTGFIVFNAAFAFVCKNKIDGYTGDTLGAACEGTEVIVAVCLCSGL